jgi:uncharacterized damage-inducible protein DinB
VDALVLLRDQAERADNLMTRVFDSVTANQADWRPDGSTTNPIATTFLHLYTVEDRVIQRTIQGKPTVFELGGWQERLGFDPSAQWSPLLRPDLGACRAYAADVRAATQEFLARIDPDALEREIETTRGRSQMFVSLTVALVIHKSTHLGEIAALLGCQGVKGFPV